ncbi:proline dehydrogenase [Bacillus altitudinis MN12]|uniref:proline dehydrogenase n=2 Tax=Bacillus TaxID=1386 RepID=A0ABV1S4H7_BACAB|nr:MULTISPECIES: proline dehydrogenase [Bacillus]AHL70235.1 proline dehydrogenase [Bacillus pumilus]EMI13990.1 proline dehydrogenase [Bacillus stratosphericus LAMA 585]KML03927.1 proline dehydrogenase [Bacillus stratosphericus]MBR3378732.1 proline dehydrogenase [Bacillus sp. (in: firmicutes)]MDH8711725.1 proline dehydrogenase [Micromonospora sp. 1209]QAR53003.1 proline dehydrogenase [Bacillus aerophilus]CVN46564.1 Proline dehydrogenase 1 [Streptococcus pneumoniae]
MESVTRNFFLFLSKSSLLNHIARNWGSAVASKKIIGGKDFESAIPVIKRLNDQGMAVTVDHLGEFVTKAEIANERTNECIQTIQRIAEAGLNSHVSLKMTSLGLDIDDDLVYRNMKSILDTAEKHRIMVTIDMEDEQRCQKTLDIFKEMKSQYEYVSTVLQAYLYRTEQDLDDLNELQPFLRLVKGAYKESAEVAYPNKKDVDQNYKKLIEKQLLSGNYTAIATHDDQMIEFTKHIVKKHNIQTDQFEFQMLYGMRSETQQALVKEGYQMRVYTPYGREWYGYYMRRLAERPANIAFALKGMTRK